MSLVERLEKARNHYDDIARLSAVQRRYNYEAGELRDLLDDSLKMIKSQLPMFIGDDGVPRFVVIR